MAKLKKMLKRARELSYLPFPDRTPVDPPLKRPIDLIKAFIVAWEAKDADAIGRLFVEDADFINVVGLRWTGRRSIVKAQRFAFTTAFPDARLELEEAHQRFLGDDAAVVIARWQIVGQVDPDGEPVDPRRGVLSATLVKLADDTWLGVSCQNTDIAAAADTNISRGGTISAASYIKGPTPAELAAADRDDR
ncbi:MAG: SgcJ/EcaC family oxidoreductase [Micropruina sp.]|uniref:SgcJ/EcaC family oxidoreductase n=1 Tax=Micropruina sp. TaxID=2737536 RepID=UPI0039E6D294